MATNVLSRTAVEKVEGQSAIRLASRGAVLSLESRDELMLYGSGAPCLRKLKHCPGGGVGQQQRCSGHAAVRRRGRLCRFLLAATDGLDRSDRL